MDGLMRKRMNTGKRSDESYRTLNYSDLMNQQENKIKLLENKIKNI
jgi:hypothetical protein